MVFSGCGPVVVGVLGAFGAFFGGGVYGSQSVHSLNFGYIVCGGTVGVLLLAKFVLQFGVFGHLLLQCGSDDTLG
jgi:hypothetical protein